MPWPMKTVRKHWNTFLSLTYINIASQGTGGPDVVCYNNMDLMGWVIESPMTSNSPEVKIQQNKVDIPLTERLLVFPGQLK